VTPNRLSRTGSEDGFTLIEILVSLAILGVSLAALLGVFSTSLDRARQSEDEMAARTLARSLIEQEAGVSDPQWGAQSGRMGNRYSWQVNLQPYGAPPASGVTLAVVTAQVSWAGSGGTRSLTLSSLRAVAPQGLP
jgi:prepilin-type N-terminal cleavage/methylation domain-containing protein